MNSFSSWNRRGREDREIADEVRAHIDERIDELVGQGMGEREARDRATQEFGNATALREEIYQSNGRAFDTYWQDLRLAARSLTRRPGFALGVALTLGLGIGATTTVFTAVDGVALRELPYKDPSTLVAVGWVDSGAAWVQGATNLQNLTPMWDPTFVNLRERARSFGDLAGLLLSEANAGPSLNGLPPERIRVAGVTPGLLDMLDAKPVLGRTFLPDEYEAKPRVALISHGTWQRRFGADHAVLGRSVQGASGRLTVIGVLPPDLHAPEAFIPIEEAPELWVPIRVDRTVAGESRRVQDLLVLGRLAPGRTLEQARAEVNRIAADLAVEFPSRNVRRGIARRIGVNDLHAQTIGSTGKVLNLFLGAAVLLLILATMNAATLLLARSLDRAKEFGVRMALGAGRVRLMSLLMIDGGILAIAGGALGVLFAYAGVALLLRYIPVSMPLLNSVAVDGRVLMVAAAVSLGTGIVAGILPALRLTRRGPWDRLQGVGRTFAGSSSRLRSILVGGQIAVAVVLVSAAGLLFTSFVRMQNSDLGFDDRGLIEVGVDTKGGTAWNFQSHWTSWDALIAELRAVPGVGSVALTSNVPFQSLKWTPRVLLPGDPADSVRPNVSGYVITPGYLNLVGTAIRAGRDFRAEDRPGSERVVLVNETFARTMLGGKNAVGGTILWSAGTEWAKGDEWVPPAEWLAGEPTPLRIVGVVEDVVQLRLGEAPRAAIYVPYTQSRPFGPRVVIRPTLPLQAVVPGLRAAVARFNPRISGALQVAPMALKERAVLRFQVMLIGAFSITAILLAAAGLYGSMLHFVGLRRREFGVRMALGEKRAGVFALVFRQGALVSLSGLGCGMVATLLSGRLLVSFLFGVQPNDAATLLAASALLVLVAAVACLVPAYRATAVDPVIVLRDE